MEILKAYSVREGQTLENRSLNPINRLQTKRKGVFIFTQQWQKVVLWGLFDLEQLSNQHIVKWEWKKVLKGVKQHYYWHRVCSTKQNQQVWSQRNKHGICSWCFSCDSPHTAESLLLWTTGEHYTNWSELFSLPLPWAPPWNKQNILFMFFT